VPKAIFIIPAALGHFNATIAIARRLQSKGLEVKYLTNQEFAATVLRHGFGFIPHPDTAVPLGDSTAFFNLQAQRVGLDVLRGVVAQLCKILPPITDTAVTILESEAPQLVVTDDYRTIVGAVAAKVLGLPWASIISTPIRQPDAWVPPSGSGLPPARTLVERVLQTATRLRFNRIYRPLTQTLVSISERYGLSPRVADNFWLSPDLTLCLTTTTFEFPRRRELSGLRYVGPCLDTSHPARAFPALEKTTGRPVAYISLGTINNHHPSFFHAAIRACLATNKEMCVIAAIGERVPLEGFVDYPSNVTVVEHAPQLDVLARASVMLTHGGMNSVSEALYFGVPLFVFPVGADQPDVAARVEASGVGIRGALNRLDVDRMAKMISKLMHEPKYLLSAKRVSESYRTAGGAVRAAELLMKIAAS
jgi:MGT family glycosyltransferase